MPIRLNTTEPPPSKATMGRKTLDNMLLSNLNHVQSGYGAPDGYASSAEELDIEWHSGVEPPEGRGGAAYQYQAEREDSFAAETFHSCEALNLPLPLVPPPLEIEENSLAQDIAAFSADRESKPEYEDYRIPCQEQDLESFEGEVVRTARGTIEFVKHDIGTYIKPIYNGCGILVQVDLNGTTLCRRSDDSLWSIYDTEGVEIVSAEIRTVYFDKDGNLTTESIDGCKVTIHTDGTVCSE